MTGFPSGLVELRGLLNVRSPSFGVRKDVQVRYRDGKQMGPKRTKNIPKCLALAYNILCNSRHKVQSLNFVGISNAGQDCLSSQNLSSYRLHN